MLQQGSVKNIVLAGNSEFASSVSRAAIVSPEESHSGYRRLLAGVQRNQAQTRESQERFASQVQRMSQIPVLHSRWSGGELTVYGLFYQVPSGLFLAYDADANTYRPLVA